MRTPAIQRCIIGFRQLAENLHATSSNCNKKAVLSEGNCAMLQLFFSFYSSPTTFTPSLRVAKLRKPCFGALNIPAQNKILPESIESLGYFFVADSVGLSSFKFSWWTPKDTVFEAVRNGPSRLPKVVDFGTNRKRVCDFLLVVNMTLVLSCQRYCRFPEKSDLTPILPEF